MFLITLYFINNFVSFVNIVSVPRIVRHGKYDGNELSFITICCRNIAPRFIFYIDRRQNNNGITPSSKCK